VPPEEIFGIHKTYDEMSTAENVLSENVCDDLVNLEDINLD